MDKKFVSYPKWGRMGRLGNQMWQLASMHGIAERYGRSVFLPLPWAYQQAFKYHIDIGTPLPLNEDINEPTFHFCGWPFMDAAFRRWGKKSPITLGGWLQSSKYFSKDIAKKLFEFTDEFREAMDERLDVFDKPVIMMGIRVGEDYVENGNYEILPINYQLSALFRYFPDWRENYNVLVFSDNYQYAKANLDCADNIYFATGFSDIEQMYLGTKCQHFIIPNSTFSWWQAYLGEKEGSIVIRPDKYFKGYLQKIHHTEDFWEPQWTAHHHKGEKFDLLDTTFMIPVKYDHQDRHENYKLVTNWLKLNFLTNIYVGEQGGVYFMHERGWDNYHNFPYPEFHRTKMLNVLASTFECKAIVNLDCDNICPILQILIGIDMIRKGEADVVYPYDGRAARLPREKWYRPLMDASGDCGIFGGTIHRGTRPIDPTSYGHIVMFNQEKFFEGGGENENFISYGPEDAERWERFNKLGYRVERVRGIVYHLDHWMGPDSGGGNPRYGRNYDELERIKKMDEKQLRKEISLWPQTKKPS